MFPEWVSRQKKPGCTVKKIGSGYYLYFATSKYDPEKRYPVSVQTYIGKITPDGVISERVAIAIEKTPAKRLGELVAGLPQELKDIVLLHVKGEWYFTKTDAKAAAELAQRGIWHNGKLAVPKEPTLGDRKAK